MISTQVVVAAFLATKESDVGSTIFFEALEVGSQAYQILRWGGTDLLLRASLDAAASAPPASNARAGSRSRPRPRAALLRYQEAQLTFTVVGDGGAAVVVRAGNDRSLRPSGAPLREIPKRGSVGVACRKIAAG